MTIYERIKARRKELGLSADEVADALGVSRATVYRYESADIENMGIDKIEPLARVLRTTPAYLMGWLECPDFYPTKEAEEEYKKKEKVALEAEEKVIRLTAEIKKRDKIIAKTSDNIFFLISSTRKLVGSQTETPRDIAINKDALISAEKEIENLMQSFLQHADPQEREAFLARLSEIGSQYEAKSQEIEEELRHLRPIADI